MEQERLISMADSLTVDFKADHKGLIGDKELVLAAMCLANKQGGDRILEGLLETGRPATIYACSSDEDIVSELSARPASLKLLGLWLYVDPVSFDKRSLGAVFVSAGSSAGAIYTASSSDKTKPPLDLAPACRADIGGASELIPEGSDARNPRINASTNAKKGMAPHDWPPQVGDRKRRAYIMNQCQGLNNHSLLLC